MTPDTRAEMVAKSLKVAKDSKLESAGFLENSAGFRSMMNSKGLFGYSKSTDVSFSVTVRNQEGTGSGYVDHSFNDRHQTGYPRLDKNSRIQSYRLRRRQSH
jgi:predicted Zn-dependent protease